MRADKSAVWTFPLKTISRNWAKSVHAAENRRAARNSSLTTSTPDVASAMTHALAGLATLGAELRELELPVPTDRTLQSAESYIFHAGFVARSSELYQPETLRRIRTGENVSPEKLLQGRQELIRARHDIAAVFTDVDLLVTPTTPIPAPAIAELKQNPDLLRPRELLLLRNTRPINVWGLPAISIPCGFTPSRITHRPANHRTTLGRGPGPAIGSRLRASDSVAQTHQPLSS